MLPIHGNDKDDSEYATRIVHSTCCVGGPTTSIPSEVVVGQPRGSHKNRGTLKGSLTRSEGKEIGSSPSDVPVSEPPGRLATERRPAAPQAWKYRRTYYDKYVSAHFVGSTYPNTDGLTTCIPGELVVGTPGGRHESTEEHSAISMLPNIMFHLCFPQDSSIEVSACF